MSPGAFAHVLYLVGVITNSSDGLNANSRSCDSRHTPWTPRSKYGIGIDSAAKSFFGPQTAAQCMYIDWKP